MKEKDYVSHSSFLFDFIFSIDTQDYESKRDYIIKLLAGVGFKIQFKPQGAFFLFAELPDNCPLSDVLVFLNLLFVKVV